jgi:very-short-patch-repair endonuclease
MIEEYEVRDQGRVIARVDFAYPDALVAVEADGYWCHSGRQDWQHDRTRRNALTSRGWRVLHVTWEDLQLRADGVVAEIQASLCIAPRLARWDTK